MEEGELGKIRRVYICAGKIWDFSLRPLSPTYRILGGAHEAIASVADGLEVTVPLTMNPAQ